MSTIATLTEFDPKAVSAFDAVIDVRSPSEFADDHVPGAINLPVLSDEERAEVGTIYVQRSKFEARRLGAAYVAKNVAAHLQGPLAQMDGGFRPLLYCWRGGMRSNSMAVILAEVGWRTTVLKGGYKTYRAWVRRRLYDEPIDLDLVLLDGATGTGKTEILQDVARAGGQVLDLEGLANHRGSLLGRRPEPQPGQKLFEGALLTAVDALDPRRATLVEAESSKIGDLIVPPRLWRVMQAAPRIELRAPPQARARYLVRTYADIIADAAGLKEALSRLPSRLGRARLKELRDLAEAGDFEALAEALMAHHYDPAYARSSRREGREPSLIIDLPNLFPETLVRAAADIEARTRRLTGEALAPSAAVLHT